VVLDEFGRTDFDKLHARAKACQWKPGLASVVYCVFEVLVHRGTDIRHQPLRRRQACLEWLFCQGASSLLRVTGFEGQGSRLFHQARLLELEGIVAKRLDSPYLAGQRSEAWLKIKRKGATPAQRLHHPPSSSRARLIHRLTDPQATRDQKLYERRGFRPGNTNGRNATCQRGIRVVGRQNPEFPESGRTSKGFA